VHGTRDRNKTSPHFSEHVIANVNLLVVLLTHFSRTDGMVMSDLSKFTVLSPFACKCPLASVKKFRGITAEDPIGLPGDEEKHIISGRRCSISL
jgi:hypothetical protein